MNFCKSGKAFGWPLFNSSSNKNEWIKASPLTENILIVTLPIINPIKPKATTGKTQEVASATHNLKRSAVVGATDVYQVMLDEPKDATSKIATLYDYAGKWIINPTLSPDGSKIAFQIVTKGLFVCNADGSGLKSLGKGSHAAWLPDSHNLMMTRIADDGHRFISSDIYCVNVDSGNDINITASSETIPVTIAVSPDGSKLAFDNDSDGIIYIINLTYWQQPWRT